MSNASRSTNSSAASLAAMFPEPISLRLETATREATGQISLRMAVAVEDAGGEGGAEEAQGEGSGVASEGA